MHVFQFHFPFFIHVAISIAFLFHSFFFVPFSIWKDEQTTTIAISLFNFILVFFFFLVHTPTRSVQWTKGTYCIRFRIQVLQYTPTHTRSQRIFAKRFVPHNAITRGEKHLNFVWNYRTWSLDNLWVCVSHQEWMRFSFIHFLFRFFFFIHLFVHFRWIWFAFNMNYYIIIEWDVMWCDAMDFYFLRRFRPSGDRFSFLYLSSVVVHSYLIII